MAAIEGALIAGRYRLDARLDADSSSAEGATLVVHPMSAWQAFDQTLQRQVFLKLVPAGAEPDFAEAHRHLWSTLARLAVPGMPAILDLGDDGGGAFLVTEWLDAEPLSKRVERHISAALDTGPLIGPVLAQGLETLAALHAAGLVHGDCAPGNIMISRFGDRVWLIDPAPVLASGRLLTTMAFAAPELKAGEAQPGPLTDLFALGRVVTMLAEQSAAGTAPAIAYQMVGAAPGFRPKSAAAARMALRGGDRHGETVSSGAPVSAMPSWASRFDVQARTTFRPGPLADQDNWGAAADPEDSPPDDPPPPGSAPDWSSRTSIANVPIVRPGQSASTDADFIVMGPTTVAPGSSFPLELWMGPSAEAATLRERAQQRGVLTESGGSAQVRLPGQTTLTACVSLPGFTIANPAEHIVWDGAIRNIAFILQSPEGHRPGEYWGTIKLLVGATPLGMVSFRVTIASAPAPQPEGPVRLDTPMQRFQTAFASYASPDRGEVFKRVQAIRASRVDVFADIASLRGGERWSDTLMREIAARDIFYLFWSRSAKASQWVEREWRQAIDKRGIEFICPIPLEDPRHAEPPPELADLHFNDWCLAIIQSEKAAAQDAAGQAGG